MRFKVKTSLLPMGYRNNKQKGFTLIELLLVLGLFAIIGALAMSFYISSTKVMVQGSRQSDLQYNISLTSKAITDELLYASDIKILSAMPASPDTNRRYIYVQDNAIKHMAGGNKVTVYNSSTPGRTYSLKFESNTVGALLDFTVSATEAGQNYNIQSTVQPLNLGDIPLTSDAGPVISYKTTVNRITFFALIKEGSKNNKLSGNVYGYIVQPTGNTLDTAGEISIGITPNSSLNTQNKLTGLIPTFISTGNIVKVGPVEQESDTTSQNFNNNPDTDPVIYTTIADDGTIAYYKVKVKLLTDGRPRAAYVGLYNYNADINPNNWLFVDPDKPGYPAEPGSFIVAEGDVVKFAYKYDANGSNGKEGLTTYELLQNSAAQPGVFNPISYYLAPAGAGINRNGVISFRVPSDKTSYNGKAYMVKVTAVSEYGVTAVTDQNNSDFGGYSRNTIVLKNDNISNFMKDFVNQVGVLLRYQATQKATFDTEGVAFIINTTADNKDGGSNLLKSFVEYIPDGDETTYKIIVDAKLEPPSGGYSAGGYGVLVGGTVEETSDDYLDNGYMVQFDPGKNGFLIRKMENGNHETNDMYGVDRIYKPADFCYGDNAKPFRDATYKKENWYSLPTFDWYQRYTMEIIVQKHATTSTDMTMRVRLYYKDPTSGVVYHSNDMWFGDFGSIKYDQTFNGVAGTNTLGLNGTSKMVGSYFGIRTWVNKPLGSSSNNKYIPNKFYNIDIKSGWTLDVTSAFTAQDKIDLKFSQPDSKEPKISLDTYDKELIQILVGEVTNSSPNSDKYPYKNSTTTPTDTLTLHLNKPPSMEQLKHEESGIPSALFISQGAFRQQYAGLVRISVLPADNMEKDITKPTFSSTKASASSKTITVTFSEPMASTDALASPENYTLNYSLPLGCSLMVQSVSSSREGEGFNPDTVTLSLTKNALGIDTFYLNTTVTKVVNVTDVAGNSL